MLVIAVPGVRQTNGKGTVCYSIIYPISGQLHKHGVLLRKHIKVVLQRGVSAFPNQAFGKLRAQFDFNVFFLSMENVSAATVLLPTPGGPNKLMTCMIVIPYI